MIALVAVALICPTPLPPRPMDVTGVVNVTSLIVSRVDPNTGDLLGTDPENHHQVSVRVCDDAKINGRSSLAAIHPGDVVLTRELHDPSGQFVAVDVEVNTMAFYARVESVSRGAIRIQPLSEELHPVTHMGPYGLLPTSATFDSATVITNEGHAAAPATFRAGAFVKVYGYKPPASAVVTAFRIEIFHPDTSPTPDVTR